MPRTLFREAPTQAKLLDDLCLSRRRGMMAIRQTFGSRTCLKDTD
jgi:hypothetical protein